MIADFFKRLTAAKETPLEASDARLSLAALLVRLARSDYDYAQSEMAQIDAILARHFEDIGPEGATALRLEAEQIEAQANDTVQFTRDIKEAVALEERTEIVEALWELILSDGTRDHNEDGAMRLIAPLLGLNDRDSAFARQRVQARLA